MHCRIPHDSGHSVHPLVAPIPCCVPARRRPPALDDHGTEITRTRSAARAGGHRRALGWRPFRTHHRYNTTDKDRGSSLRAARDDRACHPLRCLCTGLQRSLARQHRAGGRDSPAGTAHARLRHPDPVDAVMDLQLTRADVIERRLHRIGRRVHAGGPCADRHTLRTRNLRPRGANGRSAARCDSANDRRTLSVDRIGGAADPHPPSEPVAGRPDAGESRARRPERQHAHAGRHGDPLQRSTAGSIDGADP